MDNRMRTEYDDLLAMWLKREARSTRPDFSERLHARLWAAVRSEVPRRHAGEADPTAAALRPAVAARGAAHSGRRLWSIAAAVALLLAVTLSWHNWGRPPHALNPIVSPSGSNVAQGHGGGNASGNTGSKKLEPIANAPKIPGRRESAKSNANDIDSATEVVENTATGLGQWMKTTVGENQWAGLDHDAKAAIATVTGPLPFDLSDALALSDQAE
jgi:hypothetical protein